MYVSYVLYETANIYESLLGSENEDYRQITLILELWVTALLPD